MKQMRMSRYSLLINIFLFLGIYAQQDDAIGRDYYSVLQKKNSVLQKKKEDQALGRVYYDAVQADNNALVFKDSQQELGRAYYESLINKSLEHHWAAHFLFHYVFENQAFNNNHCKVNLAQTIFCDTTGTGIFTVQDIFLLSKLSFNRLVHLDPQPYNTLTNMFEPLPLPFERPALSLIDFGNFASDQYVALLADTVVAIDADSDEFGTDIGLGYRFTLDNSKLIYQAGFNIPIRYVRHVLTIELVGGTLYDEDFKPNAFPSTQESTMRQFFNDYSSLEDFFIRGILLPKGISYEPVQQKTGIGDIVLYGLVDCAEYFKHVDSLQFGINFIMPTGNKQSGDMLWQVELGNGGAFQIDLFVSGLFKSSSSLFNPIFNIAAEFSGKFSGQRRIPELVTIDETVQLIDTTIIAPFFEAYYVDAFSFYDTTVLEFADNVVAAQMRYGPKFLCSIGNYFYNVFRSRFKIGILYQYIHKFKDSIEACNQFDISLLEDCSAYRSHSISWDLAYQFDNMVTVNFGSQHVFSGINIAQTNEIFASVAIVF